MRYILSQASRTVLAELAQERTLCAFDFDGTLAPIVDNPNDAALSNHTRRLLGRLAALYPCVILSGRARPDLIGRLDGMPLERIFGNHGAEGADRKPKPRPQVKQWKATLELELGGIPGLWVEDKGLSLAVHYRQSPKKSEALRHVLRAAQNLEHARVFGGKQVVNLVVDGDPDKGTVLLSERARLRCESVLYVGDDRNDEEAFAIGGRTIAVRIGRALRSRASYFLRGQSEMDTLLELMVNLREAISPAARFLQVEDRGGPANGASDGRPVR